MAQAHVFTDKAPPPFDKEKDDYQKWLKKFNIWKSITDVDKKKHGGLLILRLDEATQDKVLEALGNTDITTDTGSDKVILELSKLFEKNKTISAFEAYENFELYKRPQSLTIPNYITEFELRWNKAKTHGMTMSTDILAYRLLKSANLPQHQEQLVRATITELNYDKMCEQMKKIFGTAPQDSKFNIKAETDFTEEPTVHGTFFGRNFQSRSRGQRGRGRWPPRNFKSDSSFSVGRHHKVTERRHFKNPLDQYGQVTRCLNCDSKNHWVQNCPDKILSVRNTSYTTETSVVDDCDYQDHPSEDTYHEITLFQDVFSSSEDMKGLVGEAMNSAVLDCGATKTVCGQVWFSCYLDSLSENDRKSVQYKDSHNKFKFGDGNWIRASKTACIPVMIGKIETSIITDIIDADIPLLLAQDELKSTKAKIDCEDDTAIIMGQKLLLSLASSGHYCLPLSKQKQILVQASRNPKVQVTLCNKHMSPKDAALKLHRQFSHCPPRKIIELLHSDGNDNQEIINEIYKISKNCKICKEYQRAPPRPIVGLPMATRFNECVAVDLKQFGKVYLLHLVDHATRLSGGTVIRNKSPSTVVRELFKVWISIYGTPCSLLTDNGGEFANAEVLEFCEQLNINVKTTAAESAWSNGLVERHNRIMGEMIRKTIADSGCSLEFAVMWCLCAKNSLINVQGFSPFQLVFSRNPTLPSLLTNKPPALNPEVSSDIIRENLNALHSARKAFIAAENSEKLKRALRHNVRTSGDIKYFTGDIVYYKRLDRRKWRGPATVLGQDGQQVLVKHGSTYVRVHPSRLQLEKPTKSVISRGNLTTLKHESTTDEQSKDSHFQLTENKISFEDISDDDSLSDSNSEESKQCVNNNTAPAASINKNESSGNNLHLQDKSLKGAVNKTMTTTSLPFKKNMELNIKRNNSESWEAIKLVSRSGKVSGKYGNEWNAINKDGQTTVIDFDRDIQDWKMDVTEELKSKEEVGNETGDEILMCYTYITEAKEEILSAKQKELDSWKSNNVYDEVDNTGQTLLSVKWILKTKIIDGKHIVKARLVTRGFEENATFRTDSPTCLKGSVRVALCIISSKGWKLHSLDYKTAFLQNQKLERKIFVQPPKEAKTSKVWRLNKSVYGLQDAPREWYLTLRRAVLDVGCRKSSVDPGVFFWHNNDNLEGILVTYVDDQLWGGTQQFEKEVIEKLRSLFVVGVENTSAFMYVGIELTQYADKSIRINQNKYGQSLSEIAIVKDRSADKSSPLNTEEIKILRSTIGKINWLANTSRPDLSFSVHQASISQKAPTMENIKNLNKLVREIKSRPSSILFPRFETLSNLTLKVYSDASFNSTKGSGSQAAYILFLTNGELSCPIVWSSSKTKRVVKSALAAETLALAEGSDHAYLWSKLIAEIIFGEKDFSLPITCLTDNKSLYDAAHSCNHLEDKRLQFEISSIRESMDKQEIDVEWIEGENQLSNVLTKFGANSSKLCEVLQRGHF